MATLALVTFSTIPSDSRPEHHALYYAASGNLDDVLKLLGMIATAAFQTILSMRWWQA